jgi:hypothetical protein
VHVLEAYADFCTYRDNFELEHGKNIDAAIRRDRLDRQRQSLHQRMRRRTAHDRKSDLW